MARADSRFAFAPVGGYEVNLAEPPMLILFSFDLYWARVYNDLHGCWIIILGDQSICRQSKEGLMSKLNFITIIVILSILLTPDRAYTQIAADQGYLLINEIGLSETSIEYVELYNPTPNPVSLADRALSFANPTVTVYFDSDAPDCPPGGLVLISSGTEFTDLDPNTTVLLMPDLQTVKSSWNYLTTVEFGPDILYWGV
jgi:hypothetical protein